MKLKDFLRNRGSEYLRELLDAAMAENERLIELLERKDARYESLVERMLELKKQGFTRPKPVEVIESTPKEDAMPSVIQAAIRATFPGDTQIYAANFTYALSQKARWEKEAEIIASEITQGRQR